MPGITSCTLASALLGTVRCRRCIGPTPSERSSRTWRGQRLGLAATHSRGAVDLPAQLKGRLASTIVTAPTADALDRALTGITDVLIDELRLADDRSYLPIIEALAAMRQRP